MKSMKLSVFRIAIVGTVMSFALQVWAVGIFGLDGGPPIVDNAFDQRGYVYTPEDGAFSKVNCQSQLGEPTGAPSDAIYFESGLRPEEIGLGSLVFLGKMGSSRPEGGSIETETWDPLANRSDDLSIAGPGMGRPLEAHVFEFWERVGDDNSFSIVALVPGVIVLARSSQEFPNLVQVVLAAEEPRSPVFIDPNLPQEVFDRFFITPQMPNRFLSADDPIQGVVTAKDRHFVYNLGLGKENGTRIRISRPDY